MTSKKGKVVKLRGTPYPQNSKVSPEAVARLDREFPAATSGNFDRDGRRIGLGTQCLLFEDDNYRRIRLTHLSNGYYISTVWLGINHNFFGDGPPIIFETMVFRPKTVKRRVGGAIKRFIDKFGVDLDMDRYATEGEAIEGHERIVAKYVSCGLRMVDKPVKRREMAQDELRRKTVEDEDEDEYRVRATPERGASRAQRRSRGRAKTARST